jgi:hypothetical protein
MNRPALLGTALAAIFVCGTAWTQPLPDTPAMANGTANHAAGTSTGAPSVPAELRVAPVDLGGAGHFVILSKTGITNVPTSEVVGSVGTSPITGAADHLTCAEVNGMIYSVDAAGPGPCSLKAPARLTSAVDDMQTAYTNAAGRRPDITQLEGGYIGGLTLAPGVYKWTTNVTISKDLVLEGGSHSVWIFQISQNLILDDGTAVVLRGLAQAQNVYWQVAGRVNMGTTSHFEGIVLAKTLIAMKTGASVNGRLLAQTAVTLEMNRVRTP